MNDARKSILDQLRLAHCPDSTPVKRDDQNDPVDPVLGPDERIDSFIVRMRAVRTEVHDASHDSWLDILHGVCQARSLNNLLVSPHTRWGAMIYAAARRFPALKDYSQPIEDWKSELFTAIDASVTGAYGGIAETGTVILWPDAHEPRAMSLVPPIHIVLLEKSRIYNSLTEAMQIQNWTLTGMPSNVILVSGPSKSADIEQTMTYGVHGPKELIVILV
ncbi:MAG: lactate utilization protein [Burkholderiales bacterium]|nr:lactate utilization protein [Burkholderiales bacterium]